MYRNQDEEYLPPACYFLVGVPAAGKSTWREKKVAEYEAIGAKYAVISSDDIVEGYAKAWGQTYTEAFPAAMRMVNGHITERLHKAVEANCNIIWDQTNVDAAGRIGRIQRLPEYYKKIAVVFDTPPEDELKKRLASRGGKVVPWSVVEMMKNKMTRPTKEEGFDLIYNAKDM